MNERRIFCGAASSSCHVRWGLLAFTVLAGACSGAIEDGNNRPVGPEGGGAGGSGAGGRGPTVDGTGGNTPVSMPPPVIPPPMTANCAGTPPAAEVPLQRLTAVQYRNTVRDLLAGSGLGDVIKDVEPALGGVPDDKDDQFASLSTSMSGQHVEAYYAVATSVADAIATRPEHLQKVAGACATKVAAACVATFFDTFGRNVIRRPLTDAEKKDLGAETEGKWSTPAEVFRALIVRLLMSPRFMNQVEIDGAPVAKQPDTLVLSPYEIASRLSYTFWRSMPDAGLMKAAADNVFKTPEGMQRELDRVFADPRTKETIAAFWAEWLKLDKMVPFPTGNKAFDLLAAGLDIGKAGKDHQGAMAAEIRELTEYVAFTKKGTFNELLTTDVSVTKSADLAKLYGTEPWTGQGEPPKLAAGSRAGLLTRAALLVNNDVQTNPFHRGALFRKRLLCDPIASPDPTALPTGALDPPPFDPNKTTRERFAAKVVGGNCQGCHTMFSDVGYILESYDALGRYRTQEKIFDDKGVYVKDLPIDVSGVPGIEAGDTSRVNGPAELIRKVAASGKVEGCFAQNFFAATQRREFTAKTLDACAVDALTADLKNPDVTLADIYKRLALQSAFIVRKVGAQ